MEIVQKSSEKEATTFVYLASGRKTTELPDHRSFRLLGRLLREAKNAQRFVVSQLDIELEAHLPTATKHYTVRQGSSPVEPESHGPKIFSFPHILTLFCIHACTSCVYSNI